MISVVRWTSVGVFLVILGAFVQSSFAEVAEKKSHVNVHTGTERGGYAVRAEDRDHNPPAGTASPTGSPDLQLPAGHWEHGSLCQRGACGAIEVCPDGTSAEATWYAADSGEILYPDYGSCASAGGRSTPGSADVEEAFAHLPLPAASLVIQPPKGKTLVNFDTVFYTTQGSFDRSVNLLGHRVTFRVRPNEFTFVFGDGHWLTTTEPGKRFTTKDALDEDITHRYLTKGTFHPSLDVTYGANFRVDGGPWRPVAGTVTIQGEKLDLEAVTATPVLVD